MTSPHAPVPSGPQLRVVGAFSVGGAPHFVGYKPTRREEWAAVLAGANEGPPENPRTALLGIRDDQAQFQSWTAGELQGVWQSPSGAAYAVEASGHVLVLNGEPPRAERPANDADSWAPVGWRIAGAGGSDGSQDVVFVSTSDNRLFVRTAERWMEIEVPAYIQDLGRPAVRSSKEVYFVFRGGLVAWYGEELVELEFPEVDRLSAVMARPDGDLLVTGESGLHVWSEAEGVWGYFSANEPLMPSIAEKDGSVYLATDRRVLAWDGLAFKPVLPFECGTFVRCGADLYVSGVQGGLFRRSLDGSWSGIDIPEVLLPAPALDTPRAPAPARDPRRF